MNILYELYRKKYLYGVTQNLGQTVVTKDEIICYVDNEKLKATINDKKKMLFAGAKNLNDEILNKYDLNKPVHYIVDRMYFKNFIELSTTEGVYLELKHCAFGNSVYIVSPGEVSLNGNHYFKNNPTVLKSECILTCSVKNLKIENEIFSNLNYYKLTPRMVSVKLETENLEIKDCWFFLDLGEGKVAFVSDNIDIENTTINCYDAVKISGNKVNIDNKSTIKSDTEIIIEEFNGNNNNNNNNNNMIMSLDAPQIKYNGIVLYKKEEDESKKLNRKELLSMLATDLNSIKINLEDSQKRELRANLISMLYQINNKVKSINDKQVIDLKNELNQKIINKILKK